MYIVLLYHRIISVNFKIWKIQIGKSIINYSTYTFLKEAINNMPLI